MLKIKTNLNNQKLLWIILIVLFVLMLAFPGITVSGAVCGLKLWLFTIVPTLFPYIVLLNTMFATGAINALSEIIYPFTKKLFKCSKNASLAILTGYLCGFPMGAKITSDLYKKGLINIDEADYLMSFCNNPSPAFILSFICVRILPGEHPILIIIILYLSSYMCSIIKRFLDNKSYNFTNILNISKVNNSTTTITHALLSSIQSIMLFGIYIIFASILSVFIKHCSLDIISPLFEITSGLVLISNIKRELLLPLAFFYISFGGISTILQTFSVTENTSISNSNYIKWKIINGIISLLFSFIYLIISAK